MNRMQLYHRLAPAIQGGQFHELAARRPGWQGPALAEETRNGIEIKQKPWNLSGQRTATTMLIQTEQNLESMQASRSRPVLLGNNAKSNCKRSRANNETPMRDTPGKNIDSAVQAKDWIDDDNPSFAGSSASRKDSKCVFPQVESANPYQAKL